MSDLSPSDDVLPELLHDPDDDGPVREALQAAIEDYYMCRGTLFKRKAPHEFASEAQLARMERHLSTVLASGREAANRLGKDSLAASLERVAETSPILRSLAPSSYRIVLEEFSTDVVVMKEASTHNIHPYNSASTNMAYSLYALLAALSLERQGERVIDSWVASNLLPAMESVSSSWTIRDGLAQSVYPIAGRIELKPHMHLDPPTPSASAPDSGSVFSLANEAPPASVDAASVNAPNPAIDAEAATVTSSTDTATKTLPKRKAGHGSTTQIPRKKAKLASDVREDKRASDVFEGMRSSNVTEEKRASGTCEVKRAPTVFGTKYVSDVCAPDVPPVPSLKGKEDIPPIAGPSPDVVAPKHLAESKRSTSTVRQQWR